MRRFIYLVVISLFGLSGVQGQDLDNIGKRFVTQAGFKVEQCDDRGADIGSPDTIILKKGWKVEVAYASEKHYVISIPKFTSGTRKTELNSRHYKTTEVTDTSWSVLKVKRDTKVQQVVNGDTVVAVKTLKKDSVIPNVKTELEFSPNFYRVAISDFSKIFKEPIPKHSFTVGIPTIPAKLRFGNGGDTTSGKSPRYFQFEGNMSLGLSGGYKYSFGTDKQYGVNIVTGFTIASVEVDSLSTGGEVSAKTSAASFSPHLGLVFDFKDFQFGLYAGFDFLAGRLNSKWNYRNQPWLGIGLGYSIFKVGGNKKQGGAD